MNLFLFRRKLGREKISVCLYPVYRGVKVSRKKMKIKKHPGNRHVQTQLCAQIIRSRRKKIPGCHGSQSSVHHGISWRRHSLCGPWNTESKPTHRQCRTLLATRGKRPNVVLSETSLLQLGKLSQLAKMTESGPISKHRHFLSLPHFWASQVWWPIAVVPEIRRLKLEDAEFEMGMDVMVRAC